MKKKSRLIALLLALLMVLPACSADGAGEDTTDSDTTAPETTEATVNHETTEEPSISVVVTPDTTPETKQ